MIEGIMSFFRLRWSQSRQYHPLPSNIQRMTLSAPSGDLELLASEPASTKNTVSEDSAALPILFVHGGFGHAAVWLPWMVYLSSHYPGRTYAVSLRGRGASWSPNFLRMWAFTTIDDLSDDLASAIAEVERRSSSLVGETNRGVVLVGHSSGGGLVQYALSSGLVGPSVAGMALVGAIPNYGSLGVYCNWWRRDKWFPLRNLVHLQHPRSPLSSTTLVHRIFFGPNFPRDRVPEFERWMPQFESMRWAMAMMRDGFLDAKDVLLGLTRKDEGNKVGGDRVLIMAGGADQLMTLDLMQRMACEYRNGLVTLRAQKKLEWTLPEQETWGPPTEETESLDGVQMERKGGVRMAVIEGAGHHMQNDVQAEIAAEALRRWMVQV